MKIALVNQPIDYFVRGKAGGSITLWNEELARQLSSRCEVMVYADQRRGPSRVERAEGIEYRWISTALDRPLLRMSRLFARPRQPAFASALAHRTYAVRLARDLRRQRCDVVHLTNFSQLTCPIRALNPKIRIFLHMQCDWLVQLDHNMIERRLRAVDRIAGCSEYITNGIRRRFPDLADRCRTHYNGTHVPTPPNDDGERAGGGPVRVLFCGRVSPEKGVHVLLPAFRKVLQRHPETTLEILGGMGAMPKSYYLDLADERAQQALEPFYSIDYIKHVQSQLSPHEAARVTFVGAVTNTETQAHYRRADVAVFPSVWNEPFGIVIIEAMASGCAVVASRCGGIPEVVKDGESGILVQPNDPDALADALIKLIEDSAQRRAFGRAARSRVQNCFTWERVAEEIERDYQRLGETESVPTQMQTDVCAAQ